MGIIQSIPASFSHICKHMTWLVRVWEFRHSESQHKTFLALLQTIRASIQIHFLRAISTVPIQQRLRPQYQKEHKKARVTKTLQGHYKWVERYIVLLMQKMSARRVKWFVATFCKEKQRGKGEGRTGFLLVDRGDGGWWSQGKRVCPCDATLCTNTTSDGNRLIQTTEKYSYDQRLVTATGLVDKSWYRAALASLKLRLFRFPPVILL